MIGQAEKEQIVGTVLAKFPEFRQKCRKIFLSAHGISVYDNGIAHGSIRDDAIHTAPEIQTFVIFQRQIGTGILAVQIQQCSGMLEFLHPMGLFLQPGTQGTDDGGKNADPAEPEQNQLGAVLTGCRGWQIPHAEDHADSLSEAVRQGDGCIAGGSKAHIMPGDPHIAKNTGHSQENKQKCLSAVAPSGRAAEIFAQSKKQKKQEQVKDHQAIVQRVAHADKAAQKIQDKNSHGKKPGIAFPFP